MNSILDFIRGAAPWVAMGLLVVILAVRSAARKKNGRKQEDTYELEGLCLGMCLGMCLGTAIGTARGNNTGLGISIGMLAGLAIGMCIPNQAEPEAK